MSFTLPVALWGKSSLHFSDHKVLPHFSASVLGGLLCKSSCKGFNEQTWWRDKSVAGLNKRKLFFHANHGNSSRTETSWGWNRWSLKIPSNPNNSVDFTENSVAQPWNKLKHSDWILGKTFRKWWNTYSQDFGNRPAQAGVGPLELRCPSSAKL